MSTQAKFICLRSKQRNKTPSHHTAFSNPFSGYSHASKPKPRARCGGQGWHGIGGGERRKTLDIRLTTCRANYRRRSLFAEAGRSGVWGAAGRRAYIRERPPRYFRPRWPLLMDRITGVWWWLLAARRWINTEWKTSSHRKWFNGFQELLFISKIKVTILSDEEYRTGTTQGPFCTPFFALCELVRYKQLHICFFNCSSLSCFFLF